MTTSLRRKEDLSIKDKCILCLKRQIYREVMPDSLGLKSVPELKSRLAFASGLGYLAS